jgi:pyruvate,water dikinase
MGGRRAFLAGSLALAACRREAPPEGTPGVTLRDLAFTGGPSERTLVVFPEGATGKLPVLIALHGRGEAVRGAEAGAYGWWRDYRLGGALTALRRGRIVAEDLQGHVDLGRVPTLNRSLATRPYRGLVVVCPHAPDVIGQGLDASLSFARWMIDTLLPRVRAECPAGEATGIDGVSLGGRIALVAGSAHPEVFSAVGSLQAAIREGEVGDVAQRARTWRAARKDGTLRLLTSDGDPFARTIAAVHEDLLALGVAHEHVVTAGPHDYSFNRGPGGIEMLLFHDRALRGEPSLLALRRPHEPSMEHPSLLPLARASDSLRKVGGKALALARAAKKGVPVPPTWVLDADPFRDLVETRLPPGHDPGSVLRLGRDRDRVDRAGRARDLVLDTMLPEGLLSALVALLREIGPRAPNGLAVRGSPTITADTAAFSGPGGAVLGVRTEGQLVDAVRAIWAGAYLPRALDHFQRRGIRDVAMAVLIQPLLVPDVSGVLATQPGARGERLVSAALGFGSPVLHGAEAMDVVRLDASGTVLGQRLAHKGQAIRLGPEGLSPRVVDPEVASAPALSASACRDLSTLARALDDTGVGPCHASFALSAGTLWVLEVQVASTRGFPEGGDASSVWSRAGVGESLPSVLSPMSWSITEPSAEASVREALSSLGCSLPRGARVLTNVHGRAYANVSAVLKAASQLPGVDPEALVSLAGGDGTVARPSDRVRATAVARLPVTAARLLALQTGLAADVSAFEETCLDASRLLADLDLAILPDDALVPTLRDVRTLALRTSKLVGGTATAHVASDLLLTTVLMRTLGPEAAGIARTLTSGAGELPCAQPALALARVSDVLRVDPAARGALERGYAIPDGPTRRALAGFLDEHGDNALREGEVSLPRWREAPAPVIAMLSALVQATHARDAVSVARGRIDAAWSLVERRVPFLEVGLVRALASRGRRFAELRDRVWKCHTRVLTMVRTVVLEADRRLSRVDATLGRDSAFFCTYDELCTALGTGRPEVAHVVRLRRAEHRRDLEVADPPATFSGAPLPVMPPPEPSRTLQGAAASSGLGEGLVRIVRDDASAAAFQAGDVLVVRSLDAGLSPLLLLASAVVSELGVPLAQGAVLARELGVPAVVHAFSATSTLREGERVVVDGDRGTVTRA